MPRGTRGCTHSRNPRTRKCRSAVEHARTGRKVARSASARKLQTALRRSLRKRSLKRAVAPYRISPLRTTRL